MPAESVDPYPGYALVKRVDAAGSRTWTVATGFDSTPTTDAVPGSSVTLTYSTSSDGITPPLQADEVRVTARLPGSGSSIGTTWVISNPATNNQTRTFRFDADPLNLSTDAARAGMVELHVEVIRTSVGTYNSTSRGGGARANDRWCRGWMRAVPTLVSHSVSNVALAGAEPTTFAYPDPLYFRFTTDVPMYRSTTHSVKTVQSGATIDTGSTASIAGPTFDVSRTAATARVDDEYAVGNVDMWFDLNTISISGNWGTFNEFWWAATGHQAGWVRDPSGTQLEWLARFTVDPRVTLANVIFNDPVTNVYNRGEGTSGTFELRNARAESPTPVAGDVVRTVRTADGTVEQTLTSSRAGAVISWSVAFAASGNVAPADAVGDQKSIRWTDGSVSITLAPVVTSPVGFLSSLLDVVDVATAFAGGTTTVYNRGEAATVTGRLLNRRGNGFAAFTGEQFRSVNAGNGALEQTLTIGSHNTGTGAFSLTSAFATSGNVAAADVVGSLKNLRWTDNSGNTAADDAYAFLSSLLDPVLHLQMNENTLDPTLHKTNRLTSDLGFYSIRIVNRRGAGKNGVTVTDHLRDDADLVAVQDRTGVTATVNGHVGYLPLLAWSAALPGGGWDHWLDAGSFEGNTFSKARTGLGGSDYSLLAIDPNLNLIVAGGGDGSQAGTHFSPGDVLQVGLTVINTSTRKLVLLDSSPAPTIIMGRFTAGGRLEYLEDDFVTWTELPDGGTANELSLFPASAAIPGADDRVWLQVIPGSATATWTTPTDDFFVIGRGFVGGTPYSSYLDVLSVGSANGHDGYRFDGAGFVGFPSK